MKRYIRPIQEFNSHFQSLKNKKRTFKVYHVGNRSMIHYMDKKWLFGNKITDENRDIVYCCRRVKFDCENAFKDKKVEETDVPDTFPTLIKNIDLFGNSPYWFRFDIESCYWNIAYHNVPLLSMETYYQFYDNKDVRNIALGSLGKTQIEEVYEKGERIKRYVNKNVVNNIYQQVRYKGYEIYLKINEICDDKVAFYHTDEYIIPDEYVDKVLRYLKSINTFPKSKDFVYYHVKDIQKEYVILQDSIFTENERVIK